ncbi:hypothetical protein FSP39_023325 [Pinctada imbricata]|uniref:Kazal-like domain-containing protein n=1 Tax=Pinctada imbricata TaxID=66713 RepID=A0AA89BP72_PINIB|nr:hypothetical protein FSP39_023325 [Pinctada imbricata]
MGEMNDNDTKCGFGGWYPSCIQRFANMWSFTIFNSISSLLTSTLAVYVGSQVPALEKQFGMSSYETGLLMSFNDIGFLCCCLFVTSVAKYVHIPRFLFLCIVLYGISGVVCALPHFLTPPEEYTSSANGKSLNMNGSSANSSSSDVPLCIFSNNTLENSNLDGSSCSSAKGKQSRKYSTSEAIKTMALSIIAIGMLLQGVAKAPRSPFLTVYVDDNVEKKKTGYFIDVDMSPRDPRWIGAWWLGFILFGAVSIFFALPISFFPRRMKRSDAVKEEEQKEELLTTKEKVKDRVLSFYRVLKNPVYVSVLVTNILQLMAIGGYLSFLSKYIKLQWTLPLWQANIVLGGTNLISISFGLFLGGVVTRKIKMTPRSAFKCLLGLFIVQLSFFVANTLLGCDQPKFVGPSSIHGVDTIKTNGTCADTCGCSADDFFPICGSNGLNYHSPCYAGCSTSEKSGTIYSNCTCIPDGKAESGLCDSGCGTLWFWAVSNFLGSFVGAVKGLISFVVKIRCVKDKDKSTAIGLQSFLLSLLAFMPAPIIFGRIVDSTCILWESCGNSGACEYYDLVALRLKLHLTSLSFSTVAAFSTAFATWWTWKWTDWTDRQNVEINIDQDILISKKVQGQTDIVRVANKPT